MDAVLLFGVFLLLLLIGIPIVAALAASSIAAYLLVGGLPAVTLTQNAIFGIDKFVLLSVPLFILTGELMNASGISVRLFDLASALVGHLRGGLAQVNVVANLFLGGISGSSSADAALTSKVLIPSMVARGYGAGFAGAITAAAAMLGPIIPPSIAMILYGSVANVSIGKLFIAGIVPGFMVAFALGLTVWLISVRRGYRGEHARASWREVMRCAGRAAWALLLPVIVVVGIAFGIVTPTEAGAIAAAYAALIGSFIYRTIRLADYPRLLLDAAVDTSIVMLIVAVAATFTFLITLLGLPQQVAAHIAQQSTSPAMFLLAVNFALLFAGMLMEATALLLTAPILVPIAVRLGIDPVHFGMIMVLNIMIGTLTPPFGQSAFIVSAIARIPVERIFGNILLVLPALLLVLAIVAYLPGTFLWLIAVLGV
ncbi:MAG: TRAP transporter large permease [Alphaproteobacteria bacterium]|nr:TRAP transporter large permease [Alphaproteobacteria bacterium]